VYGIDAGLSSLYYAIAAGIGIFAYAPSGTWGHRLGDNRIYLLGVGMTVLSVGLLTLFAFWSTPANWWLVPISFIILPVAWSPLIVSGTAITAALTPIEQGEAMGMFNATTAIGSVLSALAAGGLASKLGYASIPPVAGLFVVAGLGLMVWLVRQTKSNRAREERSA
jgi:MFS family permease